MCKAIEDGKKKAVLNQTMENITNMFKNGGSLELAIATFSNVSEDLIKNIYAEVLESKSVV